MAESCGTCRFWLKHPVGVDGRCRRYPPGLYGMSVVGTLSDVWCGEHMPVEEPKAEESSPAAPADLPDCFSWENTGNGYRAYLKSSGNSAEYIASCVKAGESFPYIRKFSRGLTDEDILACLNWIAAHPEG